MRQIPAYVIRDRVKDLCIQAATVLPEDVLEAMESSKEGETDFLAREILGLLIENALLARDNRIPVCQDTGVTHVFIEMGQDVLVEGDLRQAVGEGVAAGYTQGYLRRSVVSDPLFGRKNTGDNTPPVIYTEVVPGSAVRITVMPKGAGSENMSRLCMLVPAAGAAGVKEYVLQTVKKAGPNACPPFVVGVGIGGMMDTAAHLSKRALLRPVGTYNKDPEIAVFEKDLLDAVNDLNIGPGGLGGGTTALAVHVETYPTHIGSLPVAVNLQCHAARRAQADI